MSRNWAQVFGGVLAVAIIWVAAYWWLNQPQPRISFGSADHVSPTLQQPMISPPAGVKRSMQEVEPDAQPPPVTVPVALPPPDIESKPAPPPPAVIAPQFTDYTIQRGDTLGSIAAAKLGSARHIDAIRRSNPFKDLDKIKAGDVIRLPADPTNIQGKPVQGAPAPSPPSNRQGELLEYTVRNGDTLSKIAKDKYGSTSFQDLIFNANRDRLPSRNSLKEGQKLRLPPKPKV